MRHLWTVDVRVRPGGALHLLDKLAAVEIVDRAGHKLVGTGFRKHRACYGALYTLDPERSNGPELGQLHPECHLPHQAYCQRIEGPDRAIEDRLCGHDWASHRSSLDHGIEIARLSAVGD